MMKTTSIRFQLMLALFVLLALTTGMAAVSMSTLWKNQTILDTVSSTTLTDTNTALNLSEGVAQIAAIAPYAANSVRPILVQIERKHLETRIDELKRQALSLHQKEFSDELLSRVSQVETLIYQLLANIENELFIREDLLASQFSLDPYLSSQTELNFIDALSQDPSSIPDGWITFIEDELTQTYRADSVVLQQLLPVLSSLRRSKVQIQALKAENAFLLSSIRAQSDRMAAYVLNLVKTHQADVKQQQKESREAINSASGIMVFILVIFLGGVYYLYRFNSKMTKDLSAVTDEMLSLAMGETNMTAAHIPRQDEIGQLAKAFRAFHRNALDKQRVTADLNRQNIMLETIFNQMQDGLSAFDGNNRLLVWNQRYPILMKLNPALLTPGMHLNDIKALIANTGHENRLPDRSVAEYDDMAANRHIKPVVFERHFENGTIIEFSSRPIPSGGFVTLYRDLTERRKIEQQLVQSQKMETLGQLTGGIAHDFNNLLAAQKGNLELMDMTASLDDTNRRYLNRALTVTEKGIQMVERLLAFSSKQALNPSAVVIDELIEEILDLLDYTVSSGEELRIELSTAPSAVYIDIGGLENALLNLALNANAAMEGKGTLTLSTGHCCLVASKQMAVAIEVRDTGKGMDNEVLNRAVEPFFTTKEKGQGSGLGLSMVFGFVQQSGGELCLSSSPEQGSSVAILLPLHEREHPLSHEETHGDDERNKAHDKDAVLLANDQAAFIGKRVLLVEDDADVASPLIEILTHYDLDVCPVRSAEEALNVMQDTRDENSIDLVLSDINLGSTRTGVWLYEEVSTQYPHVPVVLMSGLPAHELEMHYMLKPHWPLLAKPVSRQQLLRALSMQIKKHVESN
ncbi:PAS-domain containing protein [Enterovibrio norvegicus]|uniref:histidine kinase n=1 Tax=Enterovibrio norvegicus DSM 15893 TaxID=1121869 RepID=A0A1I5Q8L3_9GAMM|nr:PAS-domain containing protein [Enterovibrio norvegicus]SFP42613.1 His Kinase A (phospho-acceptor) domain-containing protein [Enterovibrio norvegicus DSM 15893]